MTPSTTAASSVARAQGTHDRKTAGRASTTVATETPRFSAKIVAIHSLYTPAREPKPTSTRPIRISTPKRTRAAVRSAARAAAARIARTSFGRMLGPWRQTPDARAQPGSRSINDKLVCLGGRGSRRRPGARGRRRGQLDLIAGLQRLGRAVDYAIRCRKAGDNLDAVAEVAADLGGLHHHLVAVPENRDLRRMVARDQRGGRYLHQIGVARKLELHLAIGARGELLGRIVGLQLDQHAARSHVHRIRSRDQLCVELLAGILRYFEARLQPWIELAREGLRHLHVDPNRVHVGDLEQLLACSIARTDQGTDIGVGG